MDNFSGNVHIRPSWNNLVDLPSSLTSLLYNANISPQEVIVEVILQDQQRRYVGWSGMNSSTPKNMGIDPIFAQSLKLADNQAVKLNVKIRNHKSASIFLEPAQSQDWELVELHAAYIEAKLIEQSRCVAVGQVLVVYPTKTSSVRLQVMDIGTMECKYALIDPYAEISIAPKLREPKKPNGATAATGVGSEKLARSSRSTVDDLGHGLSVLKRGISLPHPLFDIGKENNNYELFVNREEFANVFLRHDYVSVSIIIGPQSKVNKAPKESNENGEGKGKGVEKGGSPVSALTENKQIIAKLRNFVNPTDHVALSENLAIALGVEKELGYKVLIRQASRHLSKRPSTFIVHPYITQTKTNKQLNLNSTNIKEEHSKLCKMMSDYLFLNLKLSASPLTNYIKLPIIPGILPQGGLLTFKRRSERNIWIKPFEAEKKNLPKIEIELDLLRSFSFVQNTDNPIKLETAYERSDTIEEAIEKISLFKNTGILIHGPSGSGKTLVSNWIAKNAADNLAYYVKQIRCETLMNESQELLAATFTKCFNDAILHEPSLIVLDNLDKILSAETENGDSRMANQLSETFVSQQQKIGNQANSKVSLLITGSSKEAFNKYLLLSHLLDHYIHLRAPDKNTRAAILEQYTTQNLGSKIGFDVMDAVQETEGYLPNDLKVLSERMYFQNLYQRQSNLSDLENSGDSPLIITKSAFEKAHSGYTPSNLRGVKLEKSGTSWSDIGGLTEAKRILLETLEWPTKYAPIFESCPLRLRSGILLYGYPGCGKTLLASAIAAQCGLNFISIKGPEILNKYIGASEQSVRDLFDRAQSAKPCVLFFDEFDSIAPKRGHDSTGVTDRVVNQMLTQMDGAEGLDGVYVLAATSRPDLIDSALLRPGRLDKSIICDMPSFNDRLSILECICEKMDLEPGVDLTEFATMTAGYSGADMQGICYNAYLKAVHDKLNLEEEATIGAAKEESKTRDFFQISRDKLSKLRPSEKMALSKKVEKIFEGLSASAQSDGDDSIKKSAAPTVPINRDHFLASLDETKPSISMSEKNKLQRIYSEFLTGRDGNMPDGSASNDIGGRTTLM